jgi:hypothetical protein
MSFGEVSGKSADTEDASLVMSGTDRLDDRSAGEIRQYTGDGNPTLNEPGFVVDGAALATA